MRQLQTISIFSGFCYLPHGNVRAEPPGYIGGNSQGRVTEAHVVSLRVDVLGPVTAWRDGHEGAAGQPKQLAVLGLLASRANRVVSLGQLIDAVWGDQPPATAEGGVCPYAAGLRRVLEPGR